MAREDSVRGAVERIDKRTSDLAPVLDQISDSLKRIGKAFSPKEEGSAKKETRESLLAKFSPQENFNEKLVQETNENEIVLNQLKETLERNHKESFKVFQNMENYLKVISVEGVSNGGGGLIDIIGGDGKKPSPSSKPGAKPGAKPAGAGGFLKGAARIATKAALPVAAGMAAFDAVGGYGEAKENLGIEGREATFGEKLASGTGSAVSGLTFGLLDKGATSRGIASFFGAGPDKEPKPSLEEQKKILKKDGSGFKTPEQLKAEGLYPVTGKPLPGAKSPAAPVAPTVTPPAPPAAPVAPTVTPPAPPAAPVALKVEAKPKQPPVTSTVTSPAPPAAPVTSKVEAKPKQAPSKPASVSGVSVKEKMQGENNLQKLEEKQGELQSLISEYKDEKQKVSTKLANDPRYAEGFADDPSDPEYPKELKAVDEKYKPKIDALKKEVGALSKAPGVEAAKKAQDAEDVEEEDEVDNNEPSVKPIEKPMGGKITETTTESITGGGETTRKADEGLMKKESALVALESEKETKQKELLSKLKAKGKVTGKGMAAIKEFKATDEYKQLEAEYEQKRADIGKSGGPTAESVTPTTQPSATVSSLSQENADMKAEGGAVQPVIITNNNTTSSNQQTVSPMRTSPRPTNNSFERKQSQVTSY